MASKLNFSETDQTKQLLLPLQDPVVPTDIFNPERPKDLMNINQTTTNQKQGNSMIKRKHVSVDISEGKIPKIFNVDKIFHFETRETEKMK